jgi:hypothetical protein
MKTGIHASSGKKSWTYGINAARQPNAKFSGGVLQIEQCVTLDPSEL